MERKLLALMILASLVLASCTTVARAPEASTAPAATATPPSQSLAQSAVYPGIDWSWASSPESMGWSSAKLAVAQAYAQRIGSAAVMIVDDGVVIAAWGDVTHKYFCHSMRKSLISALYGIYVAEGKIDLSATLKDLGIDDLTPLTEVEKTATVKDLLSARSGVYIEAAGEAASMKAMRPARGSHEPGTFWYYNNWDFNALGTIFDQLSGEKNIYTAFDKRIAEPIGMQDYVPEELHYGYEPYSKHPYYGFRLSTRDSARFGLLFLRSGRWSEQQVVPEDWVRESTTAHSVIGPQSGYGYMWWTGEGAGGFPNVDEGPGSYYASGYGGHEVIVMPARNLVVVHRADTDSGKMVDEASIGTLLWLILDAAGETDIGDPPLLERAAGIRLTAESLPPALRGCTLSGTVCGLELVVTYGQDDSLAVTLNGAPLTEGRWWLEGDHYCEDLGPEYGGRQCSQVVLNGKQISWFDLDGYVSMRLEYRQP
jgi:CubicO group peptidase (beta-lactamase class C family)